MEMFSSRFLAQRGNSVQNDGTTDQESLSVAAISIFLSPPFSQQLIDGSFPVVHTPVWFFFYEMLSKRLESGWGLRYAQTSNPKRPQIKLQVQPS